LSYLFGFVCFSECRLSGGGDLIGRECRGKDESL
jgi:hypothetical protein